MLILTRLLVFLVMGQFALVTLGTDEWTNACSVDKCYHLVTTKRDWREANQLCTLAEITSQDIQTLIGLVRIEARQSYVWIGAHKLIYNDWRWTDDTNIEWAPTNLNMCIGDGDEYRLANCGAVRPDVDNMCLLSSYNCATVKPIMCYIKDGDCPDDSEHNVTLYNNCYFIHPENSTWFAARYKCLQSGAELMREGDHDRFMAILKEFQGTGSRDEYRSFWIGATLGHWQWSTSEEHLLYSNWGAGQPDSGDAFCLQMNTSMWSGAKCSTEKPFICETDINDTLPFTMADETTPYTTTSTASNSTSNSTNAGQKSIIIGVIVGIVLVALLGTAIGLFLYINRKRHRRTHKAPITTDDHQLDLCDVTVGKHSSHATIRFKENKLGDNESDTDCITPYADVAGVESSSFRTGDTPYAAINEAFELESMGYADIGQRHTHTEQSKSKKWRPIAPRKPTFLKRKKKQQSEAVSTPMATYAKPVKKKKHIPHVMKSGDLYAQPMKVLTGELDLDSANVSQAKEDISSMYATPNKPNKPDKRRNVESGEIEVQSETIPSEREEQIPDSRDDSPPNVAVKTPFHGDSGFEAVDLEISGSNDSVHSLNDPSTIPSTDKDEQFHAEAGYADVDFQNGEDSGQSTTVTANNNAMLNAGYAEVGFGSAESNSISPCTSSSPSHQAAHSERDITEAGYAEVNLGISESDDKDDSLSPIRRKESYSAEAGYAEIDYRDSDAPQLTSRPESTLIPSAEGGYAEVDFGTGTPNNGHPPRDRLSAEHSLVEGGYAEVKFNATESATSSSCNDMTSAAPPTAYDDPDSLEDVYGEHTYGSG